MNTRIPSLQSLRVFEAAARHLSFKRAAEELHLTPGAVSQQIKSLEGQIGAPLFIRHPRALELTDQGRALLPPLREAFALLATAVAATRGGTPSGLLAVCAPPSFAARWLVPRLNGFSAAYPEVDLRLTTSLATIDRPTPAQGGRSSGRRDPLPAAEVLIRFGRGDYPGWICRRLFAPAYVPVCTPALLRGPPPLGTPADLCRHPLIHDDTVPELDERPTWLEWLAQAGVPDLPLTKGPRFDDASLVVAAAMAGQGVALAAKALVSAEVAAGRLAIPFDLSVQSRYAYFVTQAESTSPRPAAHAFCEWLIEAAAPEDRLAGNALNRPADRRLRQSAT